MCTCAQPPCPAPPTQPLQGNTEHVSRHKKARGGLTQGPTIASTVPASETPRCPMRAAQAHNAAGTQPSRRLKGEGGGARAAATRMPRGNCPTTPHAPRPFYTHAACPAGALKQIVLDDKKRGRGVVSFDMRALLAKPKQGQEKGRSHSLAYTAVQVAH